MGSGPNLRSGRGGLAEAGDALRLARSAPAGSTPSAAVRVQWVRMAPQVRASDCCSVVLTLHAAAIARNLDCVLTTIDTEGPHQLRVALRRLRVMVRAFAPIMRKTKAEQLVSTARRLAAIVGDLRDADVLIEDFLKPAAAQRGAADAVRALNSWRDQVRGRVRATLITAGAPDFAAELVDMSSTFDWRKRSARVDDPLARDLVGAFVERSRQRVSGPAARLPDLSHEEVHTLRKDTKALRYAVELADAISERPDARLARRLKRAQDALGFVNDVACLRRFSPPLIEQNEAFVRLRDRLVGDRAAAVAANLTDAAAELRAIDDRLAGAQQA